MSESRGCHGEGVAWKLGLHSETSEPGGLVQGEVCIFTWLSAPLQPCGRNWDFVGPRPMVFSP